MELCKYLLLLSILLLLGPHHSAALRADLESGARIGFVENVGDLWGGKARKTVAITAEAEADRVQSLPGLDSLDSSLFSGYVSVDEEAERALFYAFVESTGNPDKDPLVLWLNGLAGGFLSELGPYYPTAKGGVLQRNPYAWTQAANIVFLESPAFVGWSYSNRSSDRVVGDKRTAHDALQFLLGFLKRFPAFQSRDFWIAGESYAGHYVPNLAHEIVEHNRASAKGESIKLKGFLVGNAWTDPNVDNEGAVDFWYHHGIISATTGDALKKACNFSHVGPLLASEQAEANVAVNAKECRDALESSTKEIGFINIYDVYVDVCRPKASVDEIRQLARVAKGHPAVLGAHLAKVGDGTYDPCVDNEVESYFNRADVQKALHANQTGALPGPWTGCSRIVHYSQKDLFSSMLPKYAALLKEDLAILVYSGDVDGIVPITGTRRWIHLLGLNIEKPWSVWRSGTDQVAGRYVEHSDRFTFATVRNAGHMVHEVQVPYTQGERAFMLFSRFIHGERLS